MDGFRKIDDKNEIIISDKDELFYDGDNITKYYNTRSLKDLCAIPIGIKLSKLCNDPSLERKNSNTIIALKEYAQTYYSTINAFYNQRVSDAYDLLSIEAKVRLVSRSYSNYTPTYEDKILANFAWVAVCRYYAAKFYEYVIYIYEYYTDKLGEIEIVKKKISEITRGGPNYHCNQDYYINCIYNLWNIHGNNDHLILPSQFVHEEAVELLKELKPRCIDLLNRLDNCSIFVLKQTFNMTHFASKLSRWSEESMDVDNFDISSLNYRRLIQNVIDYMRHADLSSCYSRETNLGFRILDVTYHFKH